MSSFIITLLLHLIYFVVLFIRMAFLEALNEGQQQMAGAWPAWPDVRTAQQEAPKKPKDGATQQEAPEELDNEDEADDQPQVTYRLVQF
jgi:hypothetical protein